MFGDRLKELRKELKLSQDGYAKKLNIGRSSIANYESGAREPISSVIALICKTWNVNESWLRNGEGKMFVEVSRNDELQKLIENSMKDEDGEIKRRFATAILKLDHKQIEACTKWIKETFDLVERNNSTYPVPDDPEQLIKEKVASYEAELRAEFASKESQGASLTGSTGTESHKAI